MRKGIVIIGAILLAVGVVIAAVGLYFATQGVGSAISSFTGTPQNSVTLAPGDNTTIGTAHFGKLALIAYTDNATAPIKISSSGSSQPVQRQVIRNGATMYVAGIPVLSNTSQPILLINNQSRPLAVKYSFSESSLGAIATSGLSILGGGALFIVGLIIMIVGLAMKKKEPPYQPSTSPPSQPPARPPT